jgi:hypothetical protein
MNRKIEKGMPERKRPFKSGLEKIKNYNLLKEYSLKPVVQAKKQSKKLWGFLDGKKTILGVLITAGGLGMTQVPILNFLSTEVITAGAGMTIGGLGFKFKKGEHKKVVGLLLKLIKKK